MPKNAVLKMAAAPVCWGLQRAIAFYEVFVSDPVPDVGQAPRRGTPPQYRDEAFAEAGFGERSKPGVKAGEKF